MPEGSIFNEAVKPVKRQMVLFFLVDTSGSMGGAKIGAVNSAIEEVLPELQDISRNSAEGEIKIAVLQFSSKASWLYESPIPVEQFRWNELHAAGTTAFGDACKELNDKLSKDKFMQSATASFAPAFILLSDGLPDRGYEDNLAKLKKNGWFKIGLKSAVAIGDDADVGLLTEFTGNSETVIKTNSTQNLKNIIQFLSVTSSKIGTQNSSFKPDDPKSILTGTGEESYNPKFGDFASTVGKVTWSEYGKDF